MRNPTLTTALVILLVLPVLAGAATLDSISGTADCNGWSADLEISFRPGAFFLQLEYSVVLQDANGAEVDRIDDATFVTIPGTSTASYNFTGAWTSELDGNYTVVGEFILHDMFDGGENVTSATFISDLACGASGGGVPVAGDPCLYRARYWHRHPELWPVNWLEIGGRILDQDQLMVVMDHRAHHFTLFALTRELITAKLNLANGGNSDIQDLVDAADALLMNFTGNSRDRGQARREANRLMRALYAYNKSGCPSDGTSGVTLSLDGGSNSSWDDSADKAAIEVMALGTIKAMYR
jgi:hypothetical protein